MNDTKKVKKKKKNLAFDPNKVTSRLFQSTSSSNNKMRKVEDKKLKKRAETPQVRGSAAKNKKLVKRNWTSVKSKIDTGRKAMKQQTGDANEDRMKKGGVKRRLDWSARDGAEGKLGRSASQPPSKKRRMSAQPKSTTNVLKRWN